MEDPKGILIQQTENVQAARQIRFGSVREIISLKASLAAYIDEAAALEKSGRGISFKATAEFKMPDELKDKFDEAPELKKAFDALTPGRQRAYLLHFSSAKQSTTRTARIEKCAPQILAGRGLNDDLRERRSG